MARRTDDRIADAIAVAADRVLAAPLDAPEATAARAACSSAGVGISRFYRVFEAADDFRRAVAIHHLEAIYGLIDRHVDVAVGSLDYGEPAEVVDDGAFTEVIGSWSAGVQRQLLALAADRDTLAPVEADYLPWADDAAITAAIGYSLAKDLDRYDGYPETVAAMTGRRLVADPDEVIMRFTMSTVAGLLHRAVEEADDEHVERPVSAELQAALALALYAAD